MMTGMGGGRTSRGWWVAGLALLLPGCVAPVRSFGALSVTPADRTFAMAADGAADAAVRDALLAAGYTSAPDGRYRVEVGLAVRAPRMDVTTGAGQDMRPLAPTSNPPGLCRRQSYVLSIAFVERASGRVAARGGAVTSRCGKAADAGLLPLLAKAALAKDS